MPYVQRDKSGNITGVYASLQPGLAEEWLADADPAVVAYRTPAAAAPALPADPLTVLQTALITKGVIVQADLTAAAAIVGKPISAQPATLGS